MTFNNSHLWRNLLSIAQVEALKLEMDWNESLNTVIRACFDNPVLSPFNTSELNILEIHKWLKKYKGGMERRASIRVSRPLGTVPDPIIDVIIQGRLPNLDVHHLDQIRHAHRMSMSAENIQGVLLEEYLAIELLRYGWHCAWGDTVRSVDFCNIDGGLLQIKNRSNSENSSSNKVRLGTKIEKWYRIDASTGRYHWGELNTRFGIDNFSEENFQEFVIEALKNNPNALFIEPNNPWDL